MAATDGAPEGPAERAILQGTARNFEHVTVRDFLERVGGDLESRVESLFSCRHAIPIAQSRLFWNNYKFTGEL